MKDKKEKPVDGLRDVAELLEHLEDEGKKERRASWLKEHYSKKKQQGGSNADQRES